MPIIFDYTDYRKYLSDLCQHRKAHTDSLVKQFCGNATSPKGQICADSIRQREDEWNGREDSLVGAGCRTGSVLSATCEDSMRQVAKIRRTSDDSAKTLRERCLSLDSKASRRCEDSLGKVNEERRRHADSVQAVMILNRKNSSKPTEDLYATIGSHAVEIVASIREYVAERRRNGTW